MAELQAKWSAWIDARVAQKMAEAITTVAESIGEVIAKERVRTRAEIEAAITTARTETKLLLAEHRSEAIERLHDVVDRRFDAMERRIIAGVTTAGADAEMTLRRLPPPTNTRQ